jgi:hypothetical protein
MRTPSQSAQSARSGGALRLISTFFLAVIAVITLLGSGPIFSSYGLIQDEGTGLTRRQTLNFTGAGVTCADNAGSTRTDCTVSGVANANYTQSFTTQTSVTLTHNLNTTTTLTQCFDGSNIQIIPNSTTITSVNVVTVTFSIAQTGFCNVNGATSSGSGGGSTISAGTFAALPAAGTSGNMYLFTDSLYPYARDNGSSWIPFFQGKSMTAPTGFSWINQSTASLITTNGGEAIISAAGTAASNINGRSIAYPAAPFTRTLTAMVTPMYVNGNSSPINGAGGLFISDGTQVEFISIYGLSQMAVQYGPTFTNISTNVVAPTYTGLLNTAIWFRFNDDGTTNRTFSYSFDGVTYQAFLIEGRTTRFTPTLIGYCAGAFETNTVVKTWAIGWQ